MNTVISIVLLLCYLLFTQVFFLALCLFIFGKHDYHKWFKIKTLFYLVDKK